MTKKELFEKYNGKYFLISLGLTLFSAALYFITMKISTDYHYINMAIDDKIPFIKYFVVFYVLYFVMPTLAPYMLSFFNKRKFYRLQIASLVVVIISNIVYHVYQVKMVTHVITENDIFSKLINFIYTSEDPLNCFPSLHAAFGTAIVFALLGEKKCPIGLKIFNAVVGIGIILSTVFIKQHYFIDIVVGSLLMIIAYIIVYLVDIKYFKKKQEKKNLQNN